ncbi:SRPBCC domain-containing protein [Micromonospora sp. NPDC049679]|uniref:SRPBCC domain-containing protein n=1 Tax=Micromonospora sp. NPDC049679 TaxID=3155920 RepID=UPI0033FAD03E
MAEIQLEFDLEHPADLVWRALTERRLLARWFMPADLEPTVGAVIRLRPRDLPGFDAAVEGEVVAVEAPHTLVMRWRAEQLHTLVTWQVVPRAAGCRLLVGQEGFLGVRGTERQRDLSRTYTILFGEALPAVLDGVAAGQPVELLPFAAGAGIVPRPAAMAQPRSVRARARRGSVALIVTGLFAGATGAALAGLLPPGTVDPATIGPAPVPPPIVAVPPSAAPSTPAAPTTPPAPTPPARTVERAVAASPTALPLPAPLRKSPGPLAADYRQTGSSLLGYTGALTIRNTGAATAEAWTATVTLPPLAIVSRADVEFTQRGTTVTFTGASLAGDTSTSFGFAVTLDATALIAANAPLTCTVDGVPCRGM